MANPQLHLATLFDLDDQGRILGTLEPAPSRGPIFSLIRGATDCAWATRADLPQALADELDRLAQEEPPALDLQATPLHEDRYRSLVASYLASLKQAEARPRLFSGPAFAFSVMIPVPATGSDFELVAIEDERLLTPNFRGWNPGEIAAGRSPMLAIIEDNQPVSICFCARRSDVAAEAGLETAEAYRGRGYGPRVTAAWAWAVRATGRIPLYSTSWDNKASLAVARKLGLTAYASGWSLSG